MVLYRFRMSAHYRPGQ